MQQLGMSWLIYRLTGSAIWLGIITFATSFSSFVLMPWTGVMLDSGNRRKILAASQILGFIQAMILAGVTYSEAITPEILVFLGLILGIVNAFEMPGKHSFITDIIEDKRMMANAIALNSIAFNLARLAGPALAGIIVAKYGETMCFVCNGFSFLPFAVVLMRMKTNFDGSAKRPVRESYFKRLSEGFKYSIKHPVIMPLLVFISVVSLMGLPVQSIFLPLIAATHLSGDSSTLGFITSAIGLGAVFGALRLALRKKTEGLEKYPPRAFLCFGLVTIAMAFSRNLYVTIILGIMMGACMVNGWASSNTLLQSVCEKSKLSRVISNYMMCFSGMAPIGSLFMGWFSSKTSTTIAMVVSGSSCVFAGLLYIIIISRRKKTST